MLIVSSVLGFHSGLEKSMSLASQIFEEHGMSWSTRRSCFELRPHWVNSIEKHFSWNTLCWVNLESLFWNTSSCYHSRAGRCHGLSKHPSASDWVVCTPFLDSTRNGPLWKNWLKGKVAFSSGNMKFRDFKKREKVFLNVGLLPFNGLLLARQFQFLCSQQTKS